MTDFLLAAVIPALSQPTGSQGHHTRHVILATDGSHRGPGAQQGSGGQPDR